MITSPLRIEMVLPTLEAAGMEVMAARMARAFAARGHEVGITCLEAGGALADDLVAHGCSVAVVAAPGFRSNFHAPRLESWFRRRRPDVVHAHSGVWLKTVRAARRANVPRVVHTLHGLLDYEPWYGPELKRWAARYTDRIAAVSEPLRDYLVQECRIQPHKVDVILNGVDTERFRPRSRTGALRGRLGIGDDALVVGVIARLAPVKNHRLLLEAFARVHGEIPQARLAMVGDGPLRPALEARVRDLELESTALFLGEATDVAEIHPDLDLVVLPSKAEGTSMSVLEAMASGVPVVASAVGGTPQLLDHGRCGILVPPDDVQALANALVASLRDVRQLRALAAAARARVVALYGEQAMLAAYDALYRGARVTSAAPREDLTATGQCVA